MSVTLSRSDIEAINRAQTIALSPLEYQSAGAWGQTLAIALQSLLSADQSLTSITDTPGFGAVGRGARAAEAMASYVAYYHTLDEGLNKIRRERRLEVYDQRALYSPNYFDSASFRELESDWLRPNGLMDAIGIAVEVANAPLPIAIHLYHESSSTPLFGDRGMALLQLLLPAFKAGVKSQIALGVRRHDFARSIDESNVAILLFEDGRFLHESAAFTRLISTDPESEQVRAHARAVALFCKSGIQQYRTAVHRYRLTPSRLGPGLITRGECVTVVAERAQPVALTDDQLAERFRLTAREIQVARLIATGRQNQEIADTLGISPNTTWRHTERVLVKLGIHTRSGVGPLLID